jgi:DNA-directed RNA polymerase specialized sigma24 family protein
MICPAVVDTLDEAALINLVRRGERGSFETLVSRYERRILRLAKNITKNTCDAEDVMRKKRS